MKGACLPREHQSGPHSRLRAVVVGGEHFASTHHSDAPGLLWPQLVGAACAADGASERNDAASSCNPSAQASQWRAAFVESFNGKCRDECLNEHVFVTIEQARCQLETWRLDYNRSRLHSSLGDLTPEVYAQKHRVGRPLNRRM